MQLAENVVALGERLVVLGREFTDDRNQAYLIAHKALRSLLRKDALVLDTEAGNLREAVSRAAAALTIKAPEQSDTAAL